MQKKFIFPVHKEIFLVLDVFLPVMDIVNTLLAYVCEKMSFDQYSIIVVVTYYGFINKEGLLVPIFVHKII